MLKRISRRHANIFNWSATRIKTNPKSFETPNNKSMLKSAPFKSTLSKWSTISKFFGLNPSLSLEDDPFMKSEIKTNISSNEYVRPRILVRSKIKMKRSIFKYQNLVGKQHSPLSLESE